jgi:hypothetical protein
MMDEISIDRLVLEVPGLSADAAGELAQRVGAGLAGANTARARGSFSRLEVNLNGPYNGDDIPRLADAIVQSVMRQIG